MAPVDPPQGGVVVLVLAGGDPVEPAAIPALPASDLVIAADSGLAVADALGLDVDLVVGDLDSVDPDALAAVEARGVEVQRHPVAKARTDLEIALDAALERGPARVVVIGGHGGRVDHFLGNVLLLASDAYRALDLEAWMGGAHVRVVRHHAELVGEPGDLVSLLPVHGPARRVRTSGLLYALEDEDLTPGSTRGVSNEFAAPRAEVRLDEGVLLVVAPGLRGTHLIGRPT